MRTLQAFLLGFALPCLAGSPAAASPITYDFVSGSALLEIDVDGSTVLSTTAPLVGTSTTFDDMIPAVTDVMWDVSDSIDLGLLLGILDIDVTVTSAPGFSAPATPTGAGAWDWAGGAFDVDAMVSLTGGLLGDLGPLNVVSTVPSASGTVTVVGDTATITAAKEEMFHFFHGGKKITVFKSISFVGVPEASTLALVGLGLAALAARGRIRS